MRPGTVLLLVVIAGIAVGGGCGSGAAQRSASAPDGRTLFRTAGCGGCHTMAAAGTHGTSGPDLDTSTPRPTRSDVLFQLTYGAGGMPSFRGRLTSAEMNAVADFVARNAGRRPPRKIP